MIIDAHQHFWDMTKLVYPWLKPELKCLYRNFLPRDLRPLINETGVIKTVVVQALSSIEETKWLLQLANENDFIGAVVGWVDLRNEGLDRTLRELTKSSKFKAVRHQVEDEPNREWLLQKPVMRGLKIVESLGLRFDALMNHDQLWQLSKVMESCPRIKIVVDHASKPSIKEKEFDSWARNLESAAQLPLHCKMSGLFTEADHDNWSEQDILPYSNHIIAVFGADRVMFGSDWPVSTMASDYARTVEASIALLRGIKEAELRKILHDNARAFYNINM